MRSAYLAAVTFPSWLPEEPIASFRRTYDPTFGVIEPHITLVLPIPVTEIGADAFVGHVRSVASLTPSFEIRLNRLEKAWDHWLFLLVSEGRRR